MAKMIPPFVGVHMSNLTFEQRVHWYAIWIVAYPHQTLHFKDERINNGFLSEPHIRSAW